MTKLFHSRLFLLVASGMASLVLAEVALWLIAPVQTADGRVQFAVHQDTPGLKPDILYQRNDFGLRSLSMRTRHKPPNTVRVLVLGGSTTEQGTQNIEDTWSAILEAELRAAAGEGGPRIEVAAYGRAGATVDDLMLWLRNNMQSIEPDIVLTLVGVNDMVWKGGPGYSYDRQAQESERPAGRGLKQTCLRHSQLCRRVRILRMRLKTKRDLREGAALSWHSENLPRLRQHYQELDYVPRPVRRPDPHDEFRESFGALASFVVDQGAIIVAAGQPVLWKADMSDEEKATLWFSPLTTDGPVRASTGWLAEEMGRYNSTQDSIVSRLGGYYIDLDSMIEKNLTNYFDDCHYTDVGSRHVGLAMAPTVRQAVAGVIRQRADLND